uniref:Alkaline phosphatase n=1 Tax=Ditylum brightwellii TaxID=49249 RepID=A0A7S1ZUI3_9STRA
MMATKKTQKENEENDKRQIDTSSFQKEEVIRLCSLFASNKLVHPYLACHYFRKLMLQQEKGEHDCSIQQKDGDIVSLNFTDLAAALAMCCGACLPSLPSSLPDRGSNQKEKEQDEHKKIIQRRRMELSKEIGGDARRRKHIIFVLCDGMGMSILDHHLRSSSSTNASNLTDDGNNNDNRDADLPFLLKRRHHHSSLKAVFPSTTPAALTTLATATYPGRHGLPGWDLRDFKGCDFPGVPSSSNDTIQGPVQIRILAQHVMDVRSNRPLKDCGFDDLEDDVFVVQPWSKRINHDMNHDDNSHYDRDENDSKETGKQLSSLHRPRKMVYINAYNGDDFPNWYQGKQKQKEETTTATTKDEKATTDFSSWQMGQIENENINNDKMNINGNGDGDKEYMVRNKTSFTRTTTKHNPDVGTGAHFNDKKCCNEDVPIMKKSQQNEWISAQMINETSYDTLGQPKGSKDAIQFFSHGVDEALRIIAQSEEKDEKEEKDSDFTFTYLYTAHPDKHMHALGIEHTEILNVVRGINDELERMWNILGDKKALLSLYGSTPGDGSGGNNSFDTTETATNNIIDENMTPCKEKERVDATLIVTADHGHITVQPEDMIELPQDVLDCLEYANLGVHGKGRHAYLHCRSGLQSTLQARWRANPKLTSNFLLLTIEEAARYGLFGPEPPIFKVRPRMGDFVSISMGAPTLVSPMEAAKYRDASMGKNGNDNATKCQGAHGSLLPEEMYIPFVMCVP